MDNPFTKQAFSFYSLIKVISINLVKLYYKATSRQGSNETLEGNMVITIEPGIYIEGVGGYRHFIANCVTKDGYEVLTTFPTDLVDMTITKSNILAKQKGKFIQKYLKL